jgi:hypothetical protein
MLHGGYATYKQLRPEESVSSVVSPSRNRNRWHLWQDLEFFVESLPTITILSREKAGYFDDHATRTLFVSGLLGRKGLTKISVLLIILLALLPPSV